MRSWLLSDGGPPGGRRRAPHERGGWALVPPSRLGTPIPEKRPRACTRTGRGEATCCALTHRGTLVALLRVEAELDPLGAALLAAARKVGRVLIAGAPPALLQRVRADGTVAGGSRLAGSVRTLQRAGRGVALVATRNDVALAAADCGIGISTSAERRPPWGAHLLCGPDLESAWLVLEAATLARRVSRRSSRIALLGSVAGALLGLVDARPLAGRRALAAAGVAALASLAQGVWSARDLDRRPLPVPEDLMPWHALPIDEVLRLLDAAPDGPDRRAGPATASNTTDGRANGEPGLLAAAVAELNTPLTAPLAVGAGISAAAGSTTDAVLVLTVILANAFLSAAQEVTARRTLRRLLTAGALRVRVHRTDGSRLISADDLVPGDVVSVRDGRCGGRQTAGSSPAAGLEMDESTLTGESTPVAEERGRDTRGRGRRPDQHGLRGNHRGRRNRDGGRGGHRHGPPRRAAAST